MRRISSTGQDLKHLSCWPMKSISMSLGGNSNTYSLMKPSNSAPTGLPKDPTTSICSQALTGTPIDSSGPSYQNMGSGRTALQSCNLHQAMSPVPRPGNAKACAMVAQMAQRQKPQTTTTRLVGAHHRSGRRSLMVQGLDVCRPGVHTRCHSVPL